MPSGLKAAYRGLINTIESSSDALLGGGVHSLAAHMVEQIATTPALGKVFQEAAVNYAENKDANALIHAVNSRISHVIGKQEASPLSRLASAYETSSAEQVIGKHTVGPKGWQQPATGEDIRQAAMRQGNKQAMETAAVAPEAATPSAPPPSAPPPSAPPNAPFPVRSSRFLDYQTSLRRADVVAKGGIGDFAHGIGGMAGTAGGFIGGTVGQIPGVGRYVTAGYDFFAGHGLAMGLKRGLAAYAAVDVAGRVMGGGSLFRDKYGNTDIAGIPLI